jgi:hypothetical protein
VTLDPKFRRRWFAAICLLTAIIMLIAGETALKDQPHPLRFVVYWSSCFILTAIAAALALMDAAKVRNEQRDEQRALIEKTLQEIEREKRSRTDKAP